MGEATRAAGSGDRAGRDGAWAEHDRLVSTRLWHAIGRRRLVYPAPVPALAGSVRGGFSIELTPSQHIATGRTVLEAGVSVAYTGKPGVARSEIAIVFLVDCAFTAGDARRRVVGEALGAAIDALGDGVRFAIVACHQDTQMVYPADGPLASADPDSRAAACAAARALPAGEGREYGLWLTAAARLMLSCTAPIRHAVLVAGGSDDALHPAGLAGPLQAYADLFTADCITLTGPGNRGATTLPAVAEFLHGRHRLAKTPERLREHLKDTVGDALDLLVPDAALRLWLPQGAEVSLHSVRQVRPESHLLSGTASGLQTYDYTIGTLGRGVREFRFTVEFDEPADERLVTRVGLVAGNEEAMTRLGNCLLRVFPHAGPGSDDDWGERRITRAR